VGLSDWLRRRRRVRRGRVDVGRYVKPEAVEPPSVESVAEEGMILALSAVRMPVKNSIIVSALRDRQDFDREAAEEYTRLRMLRLAAEKEADADRTRRQRGTPQAEERDASRSRRREQVSRLLAARLREASLDAELIARLVEQSREDAWDEISRSWQQQFVARTGPDPDSAEYARNRDLRIRQLVRVDLAELARTSSPSY
jgi:hypothetical protein